MDLEPEAWEGTLICPGQVTSIEPDNIATHSTSTLVTGSTGHQLFGLMSQLLSPWILCFRCRDTKQTLIYLNKPSFPGEIIANHYCVTKLRQTLWKITLLSGLLGQPKCIGFMPKEVQHYTLLRFTGDRQESHAGLLLRTSFSMSTCLM